VKIAASLLALAALALAPLLASAANQAGVVKIVDGDARIASGTKERAAKVGDAVSEGETLITGKDSELHVEMQDAGFMVVRPGTKIEVVKYAADGDDKDHGVFNLIIGGVRSITGWIGKYNAPSYQIKTRNASVGIRGTDHETRYIPEGSSEGEPGTYDRVYAGETVIRTEQGEATIAPDQSGFQSLRPRDRPRRLAAIPPFYRPGRHEEMVARRHAEIQRVIAERREERRKMMQERRSTMQQLKSKAEAAREQDIPAAQRREFAAKRMELQRDARAAREMHNEIEASRKALQEDVKAGRATKPEARERRKALAERQKAYDEQQAGINRRLKELNETADSILK
jgi:hypothetical protein